MGDEYLCLAGEDGAVRFYDMSFRLEAWFEDLEAGPVTSVSFALQKASQQQRPGEQSGGGGGGRASRLDFSTPDFVVGTLRAFVVGMEASLFEEVDADARRGTLLVQVLWY